MAINENIIREIMQKRGGQGDIFGSMELEEVDESRPFTQLATRLKMQRGGDIPASEVQAQTPDEPDELSEAIAEIERRERASRISKPFELFGSVLDDTVDQTIGGIDEREEGFRTSRQEAKDRAEARKEQVRQRKIEEETLERERQEHARAGEVHARGGEAHARDGEVHQRTIGEMDRLTSLDEMKNDPNSVLSQTARDAIRIANPQIELMEGFDNLSAANLEGVVGDQLRNNLEYARAIESEEVKAREEADKAADEPSKRLQDKMIDQYAEFEQAGGIQRYDSAIAQFEDIANKLDSGEIQTNVTGALPDLYRGELTPHTARALAAEQTVKRTIRQVARDLIPREQITEREIEQLVDLSWDSTATPAVNAKKVRDVISTLETNRDNQMAQFRRHLPEGVLQDAGRTVVDRRTAPDGRVLVRYSDGTVEVEGQ